MSGGVPSLKRAFPWHPSFQEKEQKNFDEEVQIDFHAFSEKGVLSSKASVIGSDHDVSNQSSTSQVESGADLEKDNKLHVSSGGQGSDMSAIVSQSLVTTILAFLIICYTL